MATPEIEQLPSRIAMLRQLKPGAFLDVTASRLRGLRHRPKLDRCGGSLHVAGGLRLTKRNARIELGRRVYLWPDVKLGVSGASEPARLKIGDGTSIGDRAEIHCGKEVTIGSETLIAWDVVIMDRDYHCLNSDVEVCKPVRIGDRVWIGCRALIVKGVTIGSGAVVAAGSVVTADVPPATLVAGNPARVIRQSVHWTG